VHRDPWFAWYRRVFFLATLVYAVFIVYAALGQPLLDTVDSLTRRWFSAFSAVSRLQTGAWALMLVSGAAIVVCLVVRTVEWIDDRDRAGSGV
jgi:hypothetical protein